MHQRLTKLVMPHLNLMLQIGNTNSRIKFKCGMINFVNRWCMEGPTHHCALGVGHVLPVARRIASLLKLPHVEIG